MGEGIPKGHSFASFPQPVKKKIQIRQEALRKWGRWDGVAKRGTKGLDHYSRIMPGCTRITNHEVKRAFQASQARKVQQGVKQG